MNNTYLIGDVHGCYKTLLKLVSKLPKNSKFIFMGDAGDKGNYSYEVYDYIIKNNHTLILGNHDLMILKYLEKALYENLNNIWNTNLSFGGYKTIQSYKNKSKEEIKKHLDFIKKCPIFIEIDNVFLTHGYGLPYYKRRNEIDFNNELKYKQSFISNRINNTMYKDDWEEVSKNNRVINVYGHCDFKKIEINHNSIGIDTGCVYGCKLTALKLDSILLENNKLNINKLEYFQENCLKEDII